MRYIFISMVLLLFTTLLDASYYRSIRVISFPKESSAKKAATKLKKYIASHKNIVAFQKKIGFDVKIVKAGKYYMVVVESFGDQIDELQEIVDTLRAHYPHVYVKKIKSKTVHKKIKSTKIPTVATPHVEIVSQPIVALNKKKQENKITSIVSDKETNKTLKVLTKESKVQSVTPPTKKVQIESKTTKDKNTTASKKIKTVVKTLEKNNTITKEIPTKIATIKEIVEINKTQQEQKEKNIITNEISVAEEKKIKDVINVQEKALKSQPIINTEEVSKVSNENSSIMIVWQLLFAVTLGMLLILVKLYFTTKKRVKELIENETVAIEESKKISLEMSNKERYIAHISQELIQPSQSITNFLSDLKNSDLDGDQKDSVGKLESSLQHITMTINDIADLSQIKKGKLTLEKKE